MYLSAIERYKEIFWVLGPKKIWAPKLPICDNFATLRANISNKEHDMDNWETVLELGSIPYIVPKFHELWSTNGKNRTVVFTHPPKSSSAWQQRPSRLPALRCANISSLDLCLYAFYSNHLQCVDNADNFLCNGNTFQTVRKLYSGHLQCFLNFIGNC